MEVNYACIGKKSFSRYDFFILVFPVSSYSQITIEDTDIPNTVGTELIYVIYFYRLTEKNIQQIRKMVILR